MFIKIFKTKSAKVALLVLGVSLVVGGKYLVAFAEQFIDSFTTTDRVARTWNTTVDTGAGTVKLSTRSCDDGTWFCSLTTTCANILGDGSYIIVKRDNESSIYKWKTTDTACDKPQCGTDGGANGDNLVVDNTVNFGVYSARDACKSAGGRLPTKDELLCIYANRTSFGNNFGSSVYWSSTEDSTAYAWYVLFSNGNTDIVDKSFAYSVRCVRGW